MPEEEEEIDQSDGRTRRRAVFSTTDDQLLENGGESSDEEDEEFQLSTDITPEEERQFLVSEVQLAKLLQNCRVCCGRPAVRYCQIEPR